MAGIDGRESGSQQRNKSRLGPFQVKGDLVIAVRRDLLEVFVPGFAGIDAQLVG